MKIKILPVILLGVCPLLAMAQSTAASTHTSNAVRASGRASAEATAAVAASTAAVLKQTSAVAAVPLWMSGRAVASTGAVVKHIGESVKAAGEGTTEAAKGLWDYGTSDETERPALDPGVGLPSKPAQPGRPKDPAPGDAIMVLAQ
jgi:hypothetical protein